MSPERIFFGYTGSSIYIRPKMISTSDKPFSAEIPAAAWVVNSDSLRAHAAVSGADTNNATPSPVPAPSPEGNTLCTWFSEMMTLVGEEKHARMHEFCPRIVEKDGEFQYCPGLKERLTSLVGRFLANVCKLMGRKERSIYDGSCSVASLTRTTISGLKIGVHSDGLDIFGLVLGCVYFITTSINGTLAAERMASLFQSEGKDLCWILNRQSSLGKVIENLAKGQVVSSEDAALFNEFLSRRERISFLKDAGDRMQDSAQAAVGREATGMTPRAVTSLIQQVKTVGKIVSLSSEGLAVAQGAAQAIAGPMDIKQALADKEVIRTRIKKWNKALDILAEQNEDKAQPPHQLPVSQTKIEEGLSRLLEQCFTANLEQEKNAMKMTDVRLARGSILTSSGIALAVSNIVLWLQNAHVLHLVGVAATAAIIAVGLKIVAGVVLAGFLAAACWFGYCVYAAGQKMQEERKQANTWLADKDGKAAPSDNRYIALHQLVEAFMEENRNWEAEKGVTETNDKPVENLFVALGMKPQHLRCLLIQAESQGKNRIEWLKLKIAPLFGLDYVMEPQPVPAMPKKEKRKLQASSSVRNAALEMDFASFGLGTFGFPLLGGA